MSELRRRARVEDHHRHSETEAETDTEIETEDEDGQALIPVAPTRRAHAPKYASVEFKNEERALLVTCTGCETRYTTSMLETLLKTSDIELAPRTRLEMLAGGHWSLPCELVFKRRTFVTCPKCQHQDKVNQVWLDTKIPEFQQHLARFTFNPLDAAPGTEALQDALCDSFRQARRHFVTAMLEQALGPAPTPLSASEASSASSRGSACRHSEKSKKHKPETEDTSK